MKPLSHPASENYFRHLNLPAGDLRISLVANCNMRCSYCHNEGQGDFRSLFLSREKVTSIIALAKPFGLKKVRFTGGEPLLHPDIVDICREVKQGHNIQNVGVNTNGTLLDPLVELIEKQYIDTTVVGLDLFDSTISKLSPVGKSSQFVLGNILKVKEMGHNVQVACVYNGDYDNVAKLAAWCIENEILLKILEISDDTTSQTTSGPFLEMFNRLIAEFSMRIGVTADLDEYYGVAGNGTKILFFHSHCRLRQCGQCSRLHLRVTANGKAKPCILREDNEVSLVGPDAEHNMKVAISNLGIPPEQRAKGISSLNQQ